MRAPPSIRGPISRWVSDSRVFHNKECTANGVPVKIWYVKLMLYAQKKSKITPRETLYD